MQREVCNRCGKELDLFDLNQSFIIHTQIGYGSIHDGEYVHYRLCSECFDKLVKESKVSPITESEV